MKKKIKIKILDNRIGKKFPLPSYSTKESAGLDLCACIKKPLIMLPNIINLISSGISLRINDTKLAGLILPRSGLGHKHGIVLGNLTGLIDPDYKGPIMISLWNRSRKSYTIFPGERIAQLILLSITKIKLNSSIQLNQKNQRKNGNFGHTGKF